MIIQDFIPKPYTEILENGSVSYQSPSNIALVKYWGKYGEQLPQNASISFTLSQCRTETTLHFKKKEGDSFNFEVYLDGKRNIGFEPKIQKFLERVELYIPFVKEYRFVIKTQNTFPHSSGIASSASGMSALAMCLTRMEAQLLGGDLSSSLEEASESQLRKASFLARLGSGSAARSMEGPLIVWGEHAKIAGSSNLFGTPYPYAVHENFSKYQDTILLVDKGEKQVSSTVGHDLMHHNPYAKERFKEANNNLEKLISIFESGDVDAFISLVESEALQLHAMMMASKPYFILMKPHTVEILNRIWDYRAKTGSKVCFTLDAGANVHVLYPGSEKEEVQAFIKNELAQFCKNGEYIHDQTGLGASAI
jgi:diphosphomevalonate decarboxylase